MSIFLGATINGEHTLDDWGAVITNSDIISVPVANTTYLEVPGRNGRLDLTEALTGDVTYGNRTIKLQLASPVSVQTWYTKCLDIFNTVHGRAVNVVFDDDLTHYYKGRASVSDPQRVRNGGTFVVTVDADPFRYESTETTVTFTEGAGILSNSRMPVCPTITTVSAGDLVIGNITYHLIAGTQTVPGVILNEGNTAFTFTGGRITFKYRKGVL